MAGPKTPVTDDARVAAEAQCGILIDGPIPSIPPQQTGGDTAAARVAALAEALDCDLEANRAVYLRW